MIWDVGLTTIPNPFFFSYRGKVLNNNWWKLEFWVISVNYPIYINQPQINYFTKVYPLQITTNISPITIDINEHNQTWE